MIGGVLMAQAAVSFAGKIWERITPSFKRYLEALPILAAAADLVKGVKDAAADVLERYRLDVHDLYQSEDPNEYQGVLCIWGDTYTCFSFWEDADGTRVFSHGGFSHGGSEYFLGMSYRIDRRAAAFVYSGLDGLRVLCRRGENMVWRCNASDLSAKHVERVADNISRAIEDGLKKILGAAAGMAKEILDLCSRGVDWCDNRLASKAGDVLLLVEGFETRL